MIRIVICTAGSQEEEAGEDAQGVTAVCFICRLPPQEASRRV